jgi:hypothetical protein
MSIYDQMRELAARLKKQVHDKEITVDEATDELFAFITNNEIQITRVAAEGMVTDKPQPSM